ncbi:MAG: hypothetical protein AVO39_09895 [delta proteobacterium MLS_D]|nr:MAG: hypothetical protein AVO39_09895 [delta proteobacterium MLS_D]
MDTLLSDLKILDFSTLLPGPFATMVLADLGADVVRVEAPDRPDLNRLIPPYVDERQSISCYHAYLNRNKRSITLDLKKPDAAAVVERLAGEYDILLEQFRPGVMARLGLSYERLSSINPRLIYCSLTGYGQTGPMAGRVGHDINYLALAGIMASTGRKSTGPVLPGVQVADIGSGANNTVIAILAAALYRAKSGRGQHIDVSMTDGLFAYHAVSGLKELYGEEAGSFETEPLNGGSLYDFYETADGRYLACGALEQEFFESFCRVLGLEELAGGTVLQPGCLDESKKKIADVIRTRTMNEWMDRFAATEACVEPVLTFSEAVKMEQARSRGIIVNVPGPDGKELPQIAHPVKYSACAPRYDHAGREPGQDTRDILLSLGYGAGEIDDMEARGLFGTTT